MAHRRRCRDPHRPLTAQRGATLSEAAEHWLAGLRAGTITNRSGDPYKPVAVRDYERLLRTKVLPVLGHLRLNEVQTRDVQKLIDGLVEGGAAPATVDAAVTPLRALYRRSVARGDARANPTVGIEKPSVRPAPRGRLPQPSRIDDRCPIWRRSCPVGNGVLHRAATRRVDRAAA